MIVKGCVVCCVMCAGGARAAAWDNCFSKKWCHVPSSSHTSHCALDAHCA